MTDNTPDPKKEARHRLLNDLVSMPEAVVVAHLDAVALDTTIHARCDELAEQLARLVTLYSLSEMTAKISVP